MKACTTVTFSLQGQDYPKDRKDRTPIPSDSSSVLFVSGSAAIPLLNCFARLNSLSGRNCKVSFPIHDLVVFKMLVKLNFDINSFHILCSTITSPPTLGVSIPSPPERFLPTKRGKERPVSGDKGFSRKNNKQSERRTSGFVQETELKKKNFDTKPGLEQTENTRVVPRFVNSGFDEVKSGCGRENGFVEKVHTNGSTKWLSYGGCLPGVLQALDSVENLDEALGPWSERLGNKERTIILKEQSSWKRALEIFEWFEQKGCHELNVIHYNIMLRILGKAQKWSHVQRLWDEMIAKGISPINSTYGTLIDVYSKGGLKFQALCWLGKMSKQGVEADEITMGIVVQMYKKSGDFQKAEEYFKKWSFSGCLDQNESTISFRKEAISRVCLSSQTYNTLIDTYGKSGKLEEASQTFRKMLRGGILPTTVTFNTMIHMYGNNDRIHEVDALMKTMEEVKCPPDTRTYNILISVYTKHDDITKASEYFTKMKKADLEPDIVSYRILLYAFSIRHMVEKAEELVREMDDKGLEIDEYTQSALTRMYIEAGCLEKSWLWFQRFHLAGNMNSSGYSANIDAFGEHGHVLEAERVFMCCKEENKVTVFEFNVMIKAYGIGKRYEKACQLLESMESHGVVPDKCSYNSLIQILASADLPHRARSYLRKMQDSGFVSDCIPFCAVISSFAKLCNLQDAEELYREMIQLEIAPDVIVFGILINAYAEIGSVKDAITHLDAMKSAGLPANAVIYNSLIKLYTKVGLLEEAQETYELLRSLKPGPDTYSSNCMINLYTERSMVPQAEEIFRRLKDKGEANEFTFAMMLCMYKRMGMLEEATRIASEMRNRGILTQLLSYNNVIALYALDGRFRDAVQVFKEMVDKSVRPDDSTFRSLGAILMKFGVSRKAVSKLKATRKKDASEGLRAWVSMLCCVAEEDGSEDDKDDI